MTARLIDDVSTYANLLLSVGVQGDNLKQERPLTPIEVANLVQRMIKENNEPLRIISARLGLGRGKINDDIYKKEDTSQISIFLDLLKLSKRSQKVLGYGKSDKDKIAFSTGAVIAKLSDFDEQDKVIQSSLEKGIIKDEAIKIIQYRKAHPNETIEECIEKVLKIRPVEKITNVVCCVLEEKFRNTIESKKDKLIENLKIKLNGEIFKTNIKGKIIIIFMDDDAFNTLESKQKEKNMTFSNYVNFLIEDSIK